MVKTLFPLLMSMLLMSITSCSMFGYYNKEKAIEKFCNLDTSQYHLKDTARGQVDVPGSEAKVDLNCEKFKARYDSLLKVSSNKVDSDGFTIIQEDSNGTIAAKPNNEGGLTLKSTTKPKKVDAAIPIDKIIPVPCNCPEVCPSTTWERFWDARNFIAWALLIGFIVAFFIPRK